MRRGDPFDDWFNGSEGYGLRSERLFESLPALTNYQTQYIITWLRAAYDEGVKEGYRAKNYGFFSSLNFKGSTIEKPKK